MENPNTIVPEFLRLSAEYQELQVIGEVPPIISITSKVTGNTTLASTGIEVSGDPDIARQRFTELLTQSGQTVRYSETFPPTCLSDQQCLVDVQSLNRISFLPSQESRPTPDSAQELRHAADTIEQIAPIEIRQLLVIIGRQALRCELDVAPYGFSAVHSRIIQTQERKITAQESTAGYCAVTISSGNYGRISVYSQVPADKGSSLYGEARWLNAESLL